MIGKWQIIAVDSLRVAPKAAARALNTALHTHKTKLLSGRTRNTLVERPRYKKRRGSNGTRFLPMRTPLLNIIKDQFLADDPFAVVPTVVCGTTVCLTDCTATVLNKRSYIPKTI